MHSMVTIDNNMVLYLKVADSSSYMHLSIKKQQIVKYVR